MNTLASLTTAFLITVLITDGLSKTGESFLERQITAAPGEQVTIPCHTNLPTSVDWRYHRSPFEAPTMLFANDQIYQGFEAKISVSRASPADYSLLILSTEVKDSGLYTCIEDNGLGTTMTTPLLVTEEPACECPSTSSGWIAFGVALFLVIVLIPPVVFTIRFWWRMKRNKTNTKDVANEFESEPNEIDTLNLTSVGAYSDDKQTDNGVLRTLEQHELTDTMTTRPFTDADRLVGVTLLGEELFLINDRSATVLVCDADKTSQKPQHRITVVGLKSPKDVTSCASNRSIYITDYESACVFRVKLEGDGVSVNKWPVSPCDSNPPCVNRPMGISMMRNGDVLVTCPDVRLLRQFKPDGALVRKIKLQDDTLHAWHSVELPSGDIVLCHGSTRSRDTLHRICLMTPDTESWSYVAEHQELKDLAPRQKLDVPRHIAVDKDGFIYVADMNNRRVLLFDCHLRFVREALTSKELDMNPFRLYLDESGRRMYVVCVEFDDNGPANGKITVVSLPIG